VTKTTKTTKKNAAADEPTNEKVKLSPKEIAEAVRAPKDAAPSLGPKPPADREDLEPSGPEVTSVRVLVRMNELTVIPRRVFEHEIDILVAIHGEENIEVVEGSELKRPLIGDASDELNRLLRVYGRKQERHVLAQFANARQLADYLGIKAPVVGRGTRGSTRTDTMSAQRGDGVE